VVSSGGDEYVDSGLASGTVISSGGFSVIGNQGTAENTVIAGGGFELAGSATIEGGVTFSGSGGVFVIDSPNSPAAPVSNFVAGDNIAFGQLFATSTGSVSVKSAGIVTVSAGGRVYNVQIAGAAVGSKAFKLGYYAGYGLDLTTTASATTAAPKQTPLTGREACASLPELQSDLAQGRSAASPPLKEAAPAPTSSTQPTPGLSSIVTLLTDHTNGLAIPNLLAKV
jgi:hypothetical protein